MFITFEGIDGSGKSTCINRLREYIKEKHNLNDFIFTREPGGTNLKECEEIRKIILDKNNSIDPTTEMLLFLASRKMHVDKLIKPNLDNKVVFCDRFYDSSIAYQGNGKNIGMEKVEKINLEVLDNFQPNFTFYFKINFETSIKRMKENNRDFDRMENENELFFKKAIEGYDYLASKYKDRFIVIDAEQPIEVVFEQVINKLKEIIKGF